VSQFRHSRFAVEEHLASPCPFCGGLGRVLPVRDYAGERRYTIMCGDCGAGGPCAEREAEAWALWAHRHERDGSLFEYVEKRRLAMLSLDAGRKKAQARAKSPEKVFVPRRRKKDV
jgi:hypothetical protein